MYLLAFSCINLLAVIFLKIATLYFGSVAMLLMYFAKYSNYLQQVESILQLIRNNL